MADEQDQAVSVRISWPLTTSDGLLFADSLLATYRGGHYVLSVGQTQDPIIPRNDDVALERLRELGTLEVSVLGRFAVTTPKMHEFIKSVSALVARVESGAVENPDAHA